MLIHFSTALRPARDPVHAKAWEQRDRGTGRLQWVQTTAQDTAVQICELDLHMLTWQNPEGQTSTKGYV